MVESNGKYPHVFLQGEAEAKRYKSPKQIVERPAVPDRNRRQHGALLRGQLREISESATELRDDRRLADVENGYGIQVEFVGFPGIELAFDSLARERSGIELLNVRRQDDQTLAAVFVPDGKLGHFENLIRDYVEERQGKGGRRLDHANLINTIQGIREASLKALWTDAAELFPASDEESVWLEVWLPVRKSREQVISEFQAIADAKRMQVAEGAIYFPERTVLLVKASAKQLTQSMMTLNTIAEVKLARETAEFFDALKPDEQPAWTEDFLKRLTLSTQDDSTPYICILDTGVNRGHPLLSGLIETEDLHTIEPAWGVDDKEGHGTAMAGLALFGDLTADLAGQEPVSIGHRIESVKLLPHDGLNAGDPKHHGYLTAQAVARPEITAPNRPRVFSMAITVKDHRDRGRPSAWSASIDRIASDADSQGEHPRLVVVSAGNIRDPNAWMQYPASNTTDGIHDPGQAWNAITVGAYTDLIDITEADAKHYGAIAPEGGLSPFSTTSAAWMGALPLKPDVVFEGGNAGKDSLGAAWMPSLSLLTTHNLPEDRHYTTANATSAASALASRMAAVIMNEYPKMWPETVRALMIHSAEWTDAMRSSFLPNANPTKKDVEYLIRHCGFGVPNIERALWSAANSLTLVTQETMHPFLKSDGAVSMRDMHLHRLPWPLHELEALGEQQIQMKVTLSYFIEPNPSSRGVRSRYRYESHGLRFDVKRPLESEADFLARINAAARDEEEGFMANGTDPGWLLGKQKRHRGSIHSDTWTGAAVELASRGAIGIYPAMGWWRTRNQLQRFDSACRYSLLVSIHAPDVNVDLYSAVSARLAVPAEIDLTGF